MMGFAEDSRCIPDWVIQDALGYDLSEQDVLYYKYYIVRIGLAGLLDDMVEHRTTPYAFDVVAQDAINQMWWDIYCRTDGGMTGDYRLRDEIHEAFDLGDLDRWVAEQEEKARQVVDQRRPRRVRVREGVE